MIDRRQPSQVQWLLRVLVALGAAAATTNIAGAFPGEFAVYGLSVPTLDEQESECGCDECMPQAFWGPIPATRIFCSIHWNDCSEPCLACNGICSNVWLRVGSADDWIYFLHPGVDEIDAAIEGCRQWVWQDYCDTVRGAYNRTFSFEWSGIWVPGGGGYEGFGADPVWLQQYLRMSNLPAVHAPAWAHRVGILGLAVLSDPEGASDKHVRALELCMWYWIWAYGGDAWSGLLEDLRLPASMGPREWDDLAVIHEETCSQIGDCTTPVERTSWGSIKALYRSESPGTLRPD